MKWRMTAAILACAGCASPIVGAECRVGFELCDGRCVDLLSDPENCGGCGVVCLGACVEGVCDDDLGRLDGGVSDGDVPDAPVFDAEMPRDDGGTDDGGSPSVDGGDRDGGSDAGPPPDAGPVLPLDGSIVLRRDGGFVDRPHPFPLPDAGRIDSGATDAGTRDSGVVDADLCGVCGDAACCSGSCVDLASDRSNCGACGNVCLADETCELGACTPRCEEPTVWCGACVDVSDDPDHCGACGRRCPTGLCEAGVCLGAPPGHVVLLGHSYAESRTAIRQVVANAVWLAMADSLDVVFYDGDASGSARSAVDGAIDEQASGRSWRRVNLSGSMADALVDAEVFLVHAQRATTDEALRTLGAAWRDDLEAFVRRGGVVVVLDGEGDHAGTWQILDAAGLLSVAGRVSLPSEPVNVVDPRDALAARLPDRYRAERASVAFEGADASFAVVAHALGAVALHRVVAP
ncbi:MAG: hypothetical protein H6722_26735 [Sandaracinus sp.]|nr:hypothetical protein [Sandaracinus sp.]MCB9616048.1 hypothetical protein [Sandaracinus sp.]